MSETQERTLDHKDLPYIIVTESDKHDDGIRVYDLTVQTPGYNPVTLIKDTDLHLKKGHRYVVTGASGSGKTMTANAIMGIHKDGNGLVVMPSGVTIMQMSQTPYFSDTNFRGVLNMRPAGEFKFADRELADVLIKVELDRMVEQIPGQQTRLMIDEIMEQLPEIAKPYTGESETSAEETVQAIYEKLEPFITDYVTKHFRTVQPATEEQRDNLEKRLLESFEELSVAIPAEQTAQLAEKLIAHTEKELSNPAYDYLAKFAADTAYEQRGKVVPYTPTKAAFYAAFLEKNMQKRLARYLKNEDTDDKDREIRVTEAQTKHLAERLKGKMTEEFNRYGINGEFSHDDTSLTFKKPKLKWSEHMKDQSWSSKAFRAAAWPLTYTVQALWANRHIPSEAMKKCEDTTRHTATLSSLFHTATWPLSLLSLSWKANKASRELSQNLRYFMERQITTGETLTLSGGERQRLTIAQILLHKPDVLFVDEITAALNKEMAEKLYRDILESADEDTIIFSIAHNDYIVKHHTEKLTLANQTITQETVDPEAERRKEEQRERKQEDGNGPDTPPTPAP